MGSVGAERRRPTPVQTPEERDVWRDGGRAGWRDAGREGWREGRESGVVQSYSFDSYQLEEEEINKDAPERGVLALSEPAPTQNRNSSHVSPVRTPLQSRFFTLHLCVCVFVPVAAGYILALGPLVFVSVFDVWMEKFTTRQAYIINLVSVGVVAFGCTVQQSSFYGYMGMLPKRYTQGVMTGESTAGVIISLSRIFTKLLIPDERRNTLIFFLVSISMEMLCFLLHLLVRRSRFVRYYTDHAQGKGQGKGHDPRDNGTGYMVHHDVTAEEGNGGAGPTPTEEGVEDFVGGTYIRFDAPKAKIRRSWPGVRDMIVHRYVVSRVIWAYMLSIAVTYSITLCLFPGLESEIRNPTLGEWLPILIMATFNMSDFVGKILAALPYDWSGGRLLFFSCLRVVFIPLFVMCVYPGGAPTLSHPAWPCLFSLLMGVTNGYFGSVPMIQAAGKVPPEQRELAGNTMTVSYMTGLMVGSVVAYAAYSFTSPQAGARLPALNVHISANGTGY
ncbi:equilibrative nucleoside transporter 4 [Cynoglossus semilaevis]|uniref:equilibrative nucleoside transporter 4 n=1 Tax=Cynoglossus semilaevis TaxID=244447 RepID=UPI000D62900B|nr:equilibrative nucleoside transporter 4 [Cynoglossus semilaevis]